LVFRHLNTISAPVNNFGIRQFSWSCAHWSSL